ncbi:MAG: GerMN domain-containing protein [Lachnospiraceae bacterium]|nr:GerMN domain-containing protein [Lachnospiraceae bacterium]
MKKKRSLSFCILPVLIAALLLLGGCEKKEDSISYTIYYKNSSGTSLYEVSYSPAAETFDEMMTELLAQMSTVPEDAVYTSVIPETVSYQGYERGIDALRIDFSGEYYEMDNITEVLLRAAVVKTVSQIPGVTKIMITVDSEQLVDANGEMVAAMDAESFIDTKNGGINSYQTTSLVLYFPNEDGTKLLKEVRNVDYSSNMVLVRVILEQLMAGSDYLNRMAVINSSAEILDITTKNGTCTINFSEEFNQKPTENTPSAESALYAIVNSICETADDVDSVKIMIEGSSNVKFWDEIDLNEAFVLNESLIEVESLESETEAAAEAEEAEGEPEAASAEDASDAGEVSGDGEEISETEELADSGVSDTTVMSADGSIAGADGYAADGTISRVDGAIAGVADADASAEAQTE